MRQAVQDFRTDVRGDIRGDIRLLEGAIQGHSADIRQLKTEVAALKDQLSRLDAVITPDYRERLHRLEERVEALERGPA
jgi:hypothetical protein